MVALSATKARRVKPSLVSEAAMMLRMNEEIVKKDENENLKQK